MKKILGLDLGTNSIGWAVVNIDDNGNPKKIEGMGSRIIPMGADKLGNFDAGISKTQTAERTGLRGGRRLRERNLLRRERLHRILKLLEFLPEHYAQKLDQYGKFSANAEPKLPWRKNIDGKFEFIFQDSFNEMLADFQQKQRQLFYTKPNGTETKIPYDWTIYFLRKKALTKKVTKEELAWILLNFNQKRGYYQLRSEENEEKENENISIISSKIVKVTKGEKDKKDEKYWYEVELDNKLTYKATFYNDISYWNDTVREFVLKTTKLKDGSIKKELSFLPSFEEIEKMDKKAKDRMYAKIKLKTEKTINDTKKTVGQYIYDTILQKPDQKIKGKLVRTIERKYYKAELKQILEKQKEFHVELLDRSLYKACLEKLYSTNEVYRKSVANRDFTYLLLEDIIFYQRPLKIKKSLIDNCPYESRFDKEGKKYSVKCIAKSNPLFQEFRLWQFISNLKIFQREREINGKLETDVDVTPEFLKSEDDYTALFNWLNDRKEITQDTLVGTYFKIKKPKGKDSLYPYRWNYVEDKTYPCNETRAMILSRLEKAKISSDFLTKEKESSLWHILYSVEDKQEIAKALKTFAEKNDLGDDFVENFKKFPPFKKDYGAYSAKAIQKMLPLMRMGKYWDEAEFNENTKNRIDKIITGEYDENIKNRVREKAINLTKFSHFRGLPVWLACYVVYGRHSEAKEITKWESPSDIDGYLKTFKQHSLRNPIVEQVITETLRTVRDIWKQTEQIDEIHVELGREMKNPADKRAKMTAQIQENENTNLRIKTMLQEFSLLSDFNDNEGKSYVRPYSPTQQDILHIYEEYALNNLQEDDKDFGEKKFKKENINYDFIRKVSTKSQPSKSEILKYKLWLEQKYRSPYTGKMIPLAKLFTTDYEIEHVIPQSRYFDDSFSNKVICEAEVNKLKDKALGYEFIKANHGQIVQLSEKKTIKIFEVAAYEKFVKENYSRSRGKMKKLLMDDIPDNFIERQLNDSRYISKVVKTLLSNIVRVKDEKGEYEQEAVSKNVISCTGGITDRLKKDWGMNDVWNKIVLPRFERLNQLTGKYCFTTKSTKGHIIPAMPFELQKGFNKKRIDHRHHAMDAIVIACTTRDHVNLLNNEAAQSKNIANRYQLSHKLRRYEKTMINGEEKNIAKEFLKPWDTFTTDAEKALQDIIISFKQNLRIINKTTNFYQHFENGKKVFAKQDKGDSWAIRKPMHKETVSGEVNLRMEKTVSLNEALKNPKSIVEKVLKIKILELLANGMDAKRLKKYFDENKDVWQDVNLSKIRVYYFTKDTNERYFATRETLDASFDAKKIKTSITDTGIKKILLAHLSKYDRICLHYPKLHDTCFCFEILNTKKLNIEQLSINKIQESYTVDNGNKFYFNKKETDLNEKIEIRKNENKILFNEIISEALQSEPETIKIIQYPQIAFSPDGIDEMNRTIKELNGGKNHQPIIKVRIYEKADKFAVGMKGNKSSKFVEAAKGTNLFFAIYQKIVINKETGEEKRIRSYATIPLNIAIERQKKGLPPAPKTNEDGGTLLFVLSPNDLVYLPTNEQMKDGIDSIDKKRIYIVNDFNDCTIYFRPNCFAKAIAEKEVDMKFNREKNKISGSFSDKTASIDDLSIKEICIPLKADRLGNIIELNGKLNNDIYRNVTNIICVNLYEN